MSPGAADPAGTYRAIENLIAAYAELVDAGDFAGLGALLAEATFTGGGGAISGQDAIEKMFRDMVIVYDDGTPRTKHVTTNIAIEVDEDIGTAVSRSYFTVLQAPPGLPLQTIAAGRYRDRFERSAGQWRFADRQVRVDLTGDVSHHLRRLQPFHPAAPIVLFAVTASPPEVLAEVVAVEHHRVDTSRPESLESVLGGA